MTRDVLHAGADDAELKVHPEGESYAARILKTIEAQQAALGAPRARRSAKANVRRAGKPNARASTRGEDGVDSSDDWARDPVSVEVDRIDELEREILSLRKNFAERLDRQKYRQELLTWRGKYDVMMLEASQEFRMGKLLRSYLADAGADSLETIGALLAGTGASLPASGAAHRFRAEMDRIRKDAAVLQALLPLLEGDR